jgi:glycerate kinase
MQASILIAPDRFKGTLGAREAAEAVVAGWKQVRPADLLEVLPISNGGEGFAEILGRRIQAVQVEVEAFNARHQMMDVQWWYSPVQKTAIIDASACLGWKASGQRCSSFEMDSFGLGVLLNMVALSGARRCIVGLGGVATIDGGFGMARALGWRFLDAQGKSLFRWQDMIRLKTVIAPARLLPFIELVAAVDVSNPMLGTEGCLQSIEADALLNDADFNHAEESLSRLVRTVEAGRGVVSVSRDRGMGGGGGLGFGLTCFARARVVPGFSVFAQMVSMDERVQRSDLVVTGEGAMDATTTMGKGVGELATLCWSAGVPCVGLAGCCEDDSSQSGMFATIKTITPGLASKEESMKNPALLLTRLAGETAKEVGGAIRLKARLPR